MPVCSQESLSCKWQEPFSSHLDQPTLLSVKTEFTDRNPFQAILTNLPYSQSKENLLTTIYSFHNFLLSTHYVSDNVPDAEGLSEEKNLHPLQACITLDGGRKGSIGMLRHDDKCCEEK